MFNGSPELVDTARKWSVPLSFDDLKIPMKYGIESITKLRKGNANAKAMHYTKIDHIQRNLFSTRNRDWIGHEYLCIDLFSQVIIKYSYMRMMTFYIKSKCSRPHEDSNMRNVLKSVSPRSDLSFVPLVSIMREIWTNKRKWY